MILTTIAIIWVSVAAVFVLGLCMAAAKPIPSSDQFDAKTLGDTKQSDEEIEEEEFGCPIFGKMFREPPIISTSGDLVSF